MSGKIPNHHLQDQRLLRGWSLEKVANRLHELAASLNQPEPAVDAHMVGRWERGTRTPGARYAKLLSLLYERAPYELGLADRTGASALSSLGIETDDMPEPEDLAAAVMRLRRSYSTTPPDDLLRRVDTRLRQVRRLLSGRVNPSAHRNLSEGAAWLVLLRATVQFDGRQQEEAWTSARAAQTLARAIGHREVEAWTFETMAWMAATDGRHCDARDLATGGIEVAPRGGYGLVAATLQRARIHGAMGDRDAAVSDLAAGGRALALAGEPAFPDDHFNIDPAKASFFASGTWTQLRRPAETIENASEVVRSSDDPRSRNFWPMRVANARVEWAMALADLGDEDAAAGMATLALDPRWMRPDTERRTKILLTRMRDGRLRSELAGRLQESLATSLVLHAAPDS
jgi:transcriptional regulator with XRE-family HTH domain